MSNLGKKMLKMGAILFRTDMKGLFNKKYGQLQIQFSLEGSAWELKYW